jgi:hypothetical protein
VTDNGSPAASDVVSFSVSVAETNQPPVLQSVGDVDVVAGETLRIALLASDADLPRQQLFWSIDGPNAARAFVTADGIFTWTPGEDQIGTHSVTVRVSDNGEPPMTDAQTFSVTVRPVRPGTITVTPLTLRETTEAGGTAQFSVTLDSQPISEVALELTVSDTTEGRLEDSGRQLTFTPDNWNSAQTVTVFGVNDNVDDGDVSYVVSLDVSSQDAAFDGLEPVPVSVINRDDDEAGFEIVESDGSTRVSEGGPGDSVQVRLTSEPTADVVIFASPADGQLDLQPQTLNFTAANWDVFQTVTVQAVDDDVVEGLHSGLVLARAESDDPNFNFPEPIELTIPIEDNDRTPRVQFETEYFDGPGEGFFDSTLGEARQAALDYALTQWSDLLPASYAGETITIAARMDPLGGSASGAPLAGTLPRVQFRNIPGGVSGTWYASPLAQHIVGEDLSSNPDALIVFNLDLDNPTVLGDVGWYYGTDQQAGDDVDFVSVVMHKIGHGLNFSSLINSNGQYRSTVNSGWRSTPGRL